MPIFDIDILKDFYRYAIVITTPFFLIGAFGPKKWRFVSWVVAGIFTTATLVDVTMTYMLDVSKNNLISIVITFAIAIICFVNATLED